MKLVPLHKGHSKAIIGSVKVDEEDFDDLVQFRWVLNGDGYAVRALPRNRYERMHNRIMQPGEQQVDHMNGDRLDNQRSNLRLIPGRAEQAQNVRSHRDARSRFRGVCFCKDTGRWRATFMYQGKRTCCGRHDTEIEAAEAVDEKRLEVMPWALPDPELAKARS